MTQRITIYTDGACRGNPGPGGWGALVQAGCYEQELCGYVAETTNNRMELTAAIEGLRALPNIEALAVLLQTKTVVHLYTDSTYVKNGIEEWLVGWRRNHWRTAAKTAVKNRELWEVLEAETARHPIQWHWVRGHSGVVGNERADALARRALARSR